MGILQAIKPTEGINAPVNMKYALTNLSKTYFISEDINSLSLVPFVLLQTHPVYVAAWDHIHERVLHGGDNFQNSIGSGKDFWNYTSSDPELNGLFNAAMVSLTKVGMTEILAAYDGFKDVNTLVDLGGGHGEVLSLITDAYPHINAINFDLPHVIATAPTLPGIQHISGNLFESVPSADAIFMKHFLHIWDDEECIKLLNNCYKAVPDKGKLIIAEAVLDLTEDSDLIGSAKVVDALMLNLSPGGRERTPKQWNELLKEAGFSLSKIVGRKGTLTKIIEAIKC
jgi:caffeic acid 3-O-methyltransferase